MISALIISYDPFAMESRLYKLVNGHQEQMNVTSNIEELAGIVVPYAREQGISTIKVHAPHMIYSEISSTIKQTELDKYSISSLTIEEM